MSLTARDRKILMLVVPALLIVAYWFLLLAPKRAESARLGDELAEQQERRDEAVAKAGQLEAAKTSYAKDYETVVRLGKAIPSSVDMPSLIVQLDRAARGTGIRFKKVRTGERAEAPQPPAPANGGQSQGGQSTPAAASGGEAASTAPGKAAESANDAAKTSEQRSSAGGAESAGAAPAPGGSTSSGVPGLDSVPLEFAFSGSFFDLADFFHELKRFVRLANKQVRVSGRLMTIDGFSFESSAFPTLMTEVTATVYLSPKGEGTTAGGTSAGPQGATPPSGTTPASGAAPSSPAPSAPPAAAPMSR